jgi:hypothetical protein
MTIVPYKNTSFKSVGFKFFHHFQYGILFLIISINTFGQIKIYEKPIVLANGFEGNANYEHYDSNGQNFFNGIFEFQKNISDSMGNDTVKSIIYQGTYQNGYRNGQWIYEFDKLWPVGEKSVFNLKILQSGEGMRKVVRGYFKDGLADSNWVAAQKIVNQSQDVDTFFVAKGSFKNNVFVGDFQCKSDSLEIRGQISEHGLMQGKWIFKHLRSKGQLVENRTFENGILVNHNIELGSKLYPINHIGLDQSYGGEGEEWVEQTVSKSYFDVISETNFTEADPLDKEDLKNVIDNSNNFLKFSIFSLGTDQNVEIWKIQENDNNIQYPKLKLRRYDYSEDETKNILNALADINQSKNVIVNFFADPQNEIFRLRYDEIAYYFETLKIYQKVIKNLEYGFNKLNSPAYLFINRLEIIPHLFKAINFPDNVKYTIGDSSYSNTFDFPDNVSKNDLSLDVLTKTSNEIHNSIEEIISIVEPIIYRNKTKAELTGLELKLVHKKDSIIDLFFDDKLEDYNSLHIRYRNKIKEVSEKLFVDYSLNELEQRLDEINPLLSQFDELLFFYDRLVDIEKQQNEIQELYTRVVWNPFTLTDMQEIVKSRVFNAYRELIPYLLNQISKDLEIKSIEKSHDNLKTLFSFMREIREKDTKKMEKDLKKVRDVNVIIQTFNLNFVK